MAPAASFPGAGLDLLKLAYGRAAKAGAKSLGPPDVIATLSQLTGLPEAILDTRERVDLGDARYELSPHETDELGAKLVRLLNRRGAR